MRRPVVVLALLAVLLAPAIALPRTVEAQEPLWQDLQFVPSTGGCEGPFILEGTSWPDGMVAVEVPGHDGTSAAGNAVDGHFRIELSPELFEDRCFPGAILGVRTERLRPTADRARILGDAFYEVPSPWVLTLSGCDTETVVELDGFPPNAAVLLSTHGPPPLFADDYAAFEPVLTDDLGAYSGSFPWPCSDEGRPQVWATLVDSDHPLSGTAAHAFSPFSPTPATTGHGLARSTDRGGPLALAVAALAILGGARLATRERRGA